MRVAPHSKYLPHGVPIPNWIYRYLRWALYELGQYRASAGRAQTALEVRTPKDA